MLLSYELVGLDEMAEGESFRLLYTDTFHG